MEFTTLPISWRAVVGSERAAWAISRSFTNWAVLAADVAEGLMPRAWGAAATTRNVNNIANTTRRCCDFFAGRN